MLDKCPSRPTTPSNQHHAPLVGDTPAVPRPVHSSSYRTGTLEERRLALLCELNFRIPEVGVDIFLEKFLPPLKEGIIVGDVLKSLKERGYIDNEDHWVDFRENPGKQKGKENDIFQPLEATFENVVNCAARRYPGLSQTIQLRLMPDTAPKSERSHKTRPDAFFVLKDRPKHKDYRWYDIAVPGELKLKDEAESRDNDTMKTIHSMQFIMTLDLTRRFTFGFTIEDTMARLWFCSRGAMVVSTAFDFAKRHDYLAHVFLSLAFADKTELGWDPSISVSDNPSGDRGYFIKVGDKTYKIQETLSNTGADAIIGRATRVFTATCEGKTYVLKDVWVEDSRFLEHEIYEMILAAVEKVHGDEIKQTVATHLFTPHDHWLVTVNGMVNGRDDHTSDEMIRGGVPDIDSWYLLVSKKAGGGRVVDSQGAPMSSNLVFGKKRSGISVRTWNIQHRKHYRIVFEEVAKPIWTLKSLSDVFKALTDCAQVLHYIHTCHWVHRDISAGNVYLYSGRGILGDLEYAKRVGTNSSHEIRTGTVDFMALEVATQAYEFTYDAEGSESDESNSNTSDSDSSDYSTDESSAEGVEEKQGGEPASEPPFHHNAGHDLESLWWLAIFMLFFNINSGKVAKKKKKRKGVLSRVEKINFVFSGDPSSHDRSHFLRKKAYYMKWFPSDFRKFQKSLGTVRRALVSRYYKFEKSFPKVHYDAFNSLHAKFVKNFGRCAAKAHKKGVTISRFTKSIDQDEMDRNAGKDTKTAAQTDENRGDSNSLSKGHQLVLRKRKFDER